MTLMLPEILTLTFRQHGSDRDRAVCVSVRPDRTGRRGFAGGYRITSLLCTVVVTTVAMSQAPAAVAEGFSFESKTTVSTGIGSIRFRVAANKQGEEGATTPADRPPGTVALGDGAWETISPPARIEGKGLTIEGVPSIPAAYGAVSVLYHLPKGALVAASVKVKQGGIVLGLLDKRGEWATKVPIPPGVFWTTV
ncbi:MAG TPA: hypothetical protein VHW24_09310, partial [Bryobacteraceae bacterium]|nr:hypothetical protein [Bryobacteraceae bacterium]